MFVENIFESRYKQVPELARMGADIKVEGRIALVHGVRELHSASVHCTDLMRQPISSKQGRTAERCSVQTPVSSSSPPVIAAQLR